MEIRKANIHDIEKLKNIGKELHEENLKGVLVNTEGWANFPACLKSLPEYGIQLRKGAFDFMRIHYNN